MRIRTYAVPLRELTFVLAQLTHYTLSEQEQFERMRKAIEVLD